MTSQAVLTLCLGLGLFTATFGVANTLLFRPVPFRDADRLMLLSESSAQIPSLPVSLPNFLDWKEQSHLFDTMAAFKPWKFNLSGKDNPEVVPGAMVSALFFEVFQCTASLGRTFEPGDEMGGGAHVVVLSHGLWQRRFGASPNVIGSSIVLDGEPFIVIGVGPKDFEFTRADVWAPIALWSRELMNRSNRFDVWAIGRTKPGVGKREVKAEMNTIAARLEQAYPDANRGVTIDVKPIPEQAVVNVKTSLVVLLSATALVLLLSVLNVIGLLLSFATSRAGEFAIREALGASRSRVTGQLITECCCLFAAGAALAVPLAYWIIRILKHLSDGRIYRLDQVELDLRVLATVAGVALIAAAASGILLERLASLSGVWRKMKESGSQTTPTSGIQRVQRALVIGQTAFGVAVTIVAGLLIKTCLLLQAVQPGFDAANLITFQISLPQAKYANPSSLQAFYDSFERGIASLPGVESVGSGQYLPMSGYFNFNDFTIEGQPAVADVSKVEFFPVTPHYIGTLRIPLLRGRHFTDADRPENPPVAIIDEVMAKRYWPGQDPIGRRLKLARPQEWAPWIAVVGVVGHVKHMGLDAKDSPELYLPFAQRPRRQMSVVVRAAMNVESISEAIRRTVTRLDHDQPVYNYQTMEQAIGRTLLPRRVFAVLMSMLGAAGLSLISIGTYSAVKYSVLTRRREIGIRIALGAEPIEIEGRVVRQGVAWICAGILAGMLFGKILATLISSSLYAVQELDVLTYGVVAALVCALAAIGCYLPARKAARSPAMAALRD